MEEQKISFESLHCPDCGGSLTPISTLITDWPYVHTDTELRCTKCYELNKEGKFVFGIPLDPLAGTGLEIYDDSPLVVLSAALEVQTPFCPWHRKPMRMTKIFGDRVFKEEGRKRVQFKCTYCYLTYQEDIEVGNIK